MVFAAALALQFGSTQGQFGTPLTNIFVWKRGAMSQAVNQATYVLNNEASFRQYWSRNQLGNAPTDIDWLKQMVVAVHIGNRPNAGYELQLGSTEVKGSEIWLHMHERLPGEGSMAAQVRTSPWMLVRLDKTSWSIKTDFQQLPSRDNGVMMPNGSTVYKWGGTTVIVPPSNNGLVDLGWCNYYGGYDCSQDDSGYVIFDSGQELQRYWNRSLRLDDSLAPRVIDWQNERVIAIHLGKQNVRGVQPVVRSVRKEGTTGYITVKTSVSDEATKGTSRPYLLLRVDRSVPIWRVKIEK